MSESNQLDEPAPTSIVEALSKTKDAAEEIKKVADDLLVVQAVLKKEIAQNTQPDLVDRAVDQAGELEQRLTKSADLLDEVNETPSKPPKGSTSQAEVRTEVLRRKMRRAIDPRASVSRTGDLPTSWQGTLCANSSASRPHVAIHYRAPYGVPRCRSIPSSSRTARQFATT